MEDKRNETDSFAGWLRERGVLVLLNCCLSVLWWLVAFATFEVMQKSDPWGAYTLHGILLNVGKGVFSLAIIGCALWRRLSLALPLTTLLIARFLVIMSLPLVAMSRSTHRNLVSINPYYGMKDRSTRFFTFAVVPIPGIVFASKRRVKNIVAPEE